MLQPFWEVAQEGLERLEQNLSPNLSLGDITDPQLAFQTATTMLGIWGIIDERKETTKLWALQAPECVSSQIIALHANPIEPIRDILEEVLELAKRIKAKGEWNYGKHVVPNPSPDMTLRVKIFHTEIDVTADSNVDALIARHDAAGSAPIPVFGADKPAGIVGSSVVIIR
jgi:hypothetical protein